MKGLVKKIISGLLSTAMLTVCATSFTSCKSDDTPKTTNSSFNYETDMQYMYYGGGTYAPMTKSDTGYYYVGEHDMIIYIDKESQKATPLCSKPNCLHTDDKACDAYFDLGATVDTSFGTSSVPIQYYKGNLYMVIREEDNDGIIYSYLIRTDKSGKNKEYLTGKLDFNTSKWMIHRGYFYYATDFSIKRISLDNPKEEPQEVFTLNENETYEGNVNAFYILVAYDNYIYFNVQEYNVENHTIGGLVPYIVDLSTMKAVKREYNGNYCYTETFYNDELISFTNDVANKNLTYYISDLNGDNMEVLSGECFANTSNYSDGKYFYNDNQSEAYKNNVAHIITVYDKDSNKVDSFKLKEGKGITEFFPQDEDYFIFTAKDENGEEQLVMADKSQIGNINGGVIEYKTLCKLNWYEVTNSPYIVVKENDEESDVKEQGSVEEITFDKIKEDTKNLGYNVSDDYDTFNNKNVLDGFSVKLSWKGGGGVYSGDFQILNFTDVDSAEEFKTENPLTISNKERIAYISIEEIPTEIYKMLSSIISGNPIAPIEVDDFSGDSYKIN